MPVAHWYSSGWKRWCSLWSISVIANGPRRSARIAYRPAKPPPTITTRSRALPSIPENPLTDRTDRPRYPAGPGLGQRVVPGIAPVQQHVGFLRAPAVLGVRANRSGVAEYRVDHAPRGLHGVLPGEESPVPGERRPDQAVVRTHVRGRLLSEGERLELRPPASALLLPGQGHTHPGRWVDPENQCVEGLGSWLEAEHIAGGMVELDGDLGCRDGQALARSDHDRHACPAPRV